MKNKLKELAPLILVLFTCLIIAIILINKPKKEVKILEYDTSFLSNIKVSEAIKEFKSSDTKIYIIGRSTCSISQKFLPILKEVVNEYKAKIYYIDLEEMLDDKTSLKEFKKLLTFEYTYENKTQDMASYIGATPMIIISQNNKNIYGSLGYMSKNDLKNLLRSYELI